MKLDKDLKQLTLEVNSIARKAQLIVETEIESLLNKLKEHTTISNETG